MPTLKSPPRRVAGDDATLIGILKAGFQAIESNLGSLINHPVKLGPGDPCLNDGHELSEFGKGPFSILSGKLDTDHEGTIHLIFTLEDAIALSSFMMMVPDETVASNRANLNWDKDVQESCSEVGNVIFSALDEAFRSSVKGEVHLEKKDLSKVELPGQPPGGWGDEPFYVLPFTMKAGDLPEGKACLAIPMGAAGSLNGSPLTGGGEEEGGSAGEEALEEVEIRGTLSAYVSTKEILSVLKRSCRRIGFELDKRPKAEIPNPAVYENGRVLIEIGRGQTRRFDWCRRLKAREDVMVALILVQPSKSGVVLAYESGADAIMGWPMEESVLCEKLEPLLEETGF